MLLRILPDHQKLFFQKRYFLLSGVIKTCSDAFAHTPRPPKSFFQKDVLERL
jgi:hypothetical protein